MRHAAWALLVLAAFLLGLYLGQRQARLPGLDAPGGARPNPVAVAPSASLPESRPSGAEPAGGPGIAPAAAARSEAAWAAALASLDQLSRRGEGAAAAELAGALLAEIRSLAQAGGGATAAARLDAYLRRNPFDAKAHLLAADLWQMRGRRDAALEPLLALLEFADEPAVIREARDKLALLVNVHETELANRGDVAGLVRYFEDLSARDPGYDGHRLRLAQWLLRAGRLEEAQRALNEMGTVGVDPRAREDLVAALTLARTGLPLERRPGAAGGAGALYVRASAGGRALRLLVDTGASTTALTRSRAAALGAAKTGQRVSVRTAGGVVDAEVRRLREVEVGALRIESLEVLVLDQALPDGVDGLLGMDVLSRFPGIAGGTLTGP